MPPQHPATPPQAAPLHRLSRPLYAGDPGNSVCADQVGDSVRAMKAPSADQVGDSVLIAQPSRVSGRHVPRASLVVTSLARLWSSRPSRVSGRHVPPASLVGTSLARLWSARPSRVSGRHVPPASLVVTSLPRLWSSRPSLPSGRHVPDKTPSSASFQCLALLWLSRPPSRQAAGRGGAAAGAGGPARRRRARQDAAARVRPPPARRSLGARTGGEVSLTSQESFRPQLLVYGPNKLQKCLQWGSDRRPRRRVFGLVSGSFH